MLKHTQNFLTSRQLVKKIVALAKIEAGATILEIGPGKGIITEALAQVTGKAGSVIAVELDQKLYQSLIDRFHAVPHVDLRQGDFLEFDLAQLPKPYTVFANVPFNVTAPLLDKLFTPTEGPASAHLILQRDALIGLSRAQHRLETLKGLLIKPFYQIEERHQFKPSDFQPSPGVATSLFAFEKRRRAFIDVIDYAAYKDFLSYLSKDRVGEGVWLKLFSSRQIRALATHSALVPNRGLKSQTVEALIAAFKLFKTVPASKQAIIHHAAAGLREAQARVKRLNVKGGHHRSRARQGKPRKSR